MATWRPHRERTPTANGRPRRRRPAPACWGWRYRRRSPRELSWSALVPAGQRTKAHTSRDTGANSKRERTVRTRRRSDAPHGVRDNLYTTTCNSSSGLGRWGRGRRRGRGRVRRGEIADLAHHLARRVETRVDHGFQNFGGVWEDRTFRHFFSRLINHVVQRAQDSDGHTGLLSASAAGISSLV